MCKFSISYILVCLACECSLQLLVWCRPPFMRAPAQILRNGRYHKTSATPDHLIVLTVISFIAICSYTHTHARTHTHTHTVCVLAIAMLQGDNESSFADGVFSVEACKLNQYVWLEIRNVTTLHVCILFTCLSILPISKTTCTMQSAVGTHNHKAS